MSFGRGILFFSVVREIRGRAVQKEAGGQVYSTRVAAALVKTPLRGNADRGKAPKAWNLGKKIFLFLCFVFIQKYYGRKSPTGRDVCRLRKAYYNARHEASAQIDEIVGETASEADSSETSVCEKENGHEKDEDVIRCICGLYKDEGLMIQCEKCMVRQGEHATEPGALFPSFITS